MAEFQPAFEYMMDHEDSHWRDPRRAGRITVDSGGKTRFGIASKFHPDLPAEFFTCDKDEAFALARSLYESRYWETMQIACLVDQMVADKLLDMAVNMGVGEAAKLAQRSANLLLPLASRPAVDSAWGPETTAALNGCPPDDLLKWLCQMSKLDYALDAEKRPAEAKYLPGWLKRAACRPDHLCDEHGLGIEHPAQGAIAGGAQ